MGIMNPMEIKKSIENDFKSAMKAGDEVTKRALRMVLASIKLAEVDQGHEITEQDILSILQKEIKSLREAIADAEKAGRDDLIPGIEAEIKVLEQYTPQSLNEQEIIELAKGVIDEVGASSPQDMGKVMKELMPKIQGRAEGAVVSSQVRKLLSNE